MRYALFGAPVLFPTGVAMAFERMTYGLVYGLSRWQGGLSGVLLRWRSWGLPAKVLLGGCS